jgi:gamma-glutamyltranspeptidase / glutathione hydrolase
MEGAIAAGHPETAVAGARVLAEGGNAVDACVGAGFASWVAESPLTGPGGGGFMLVYRASDASTRMLDFFVGVPSGAGAEMEEISVAFDPETTQLFRIGKASCAVPGTALGLETAHRAFGRLPWRTLVEPAIELAETGVELNEAQAFLHTILDVILRSTEESRAIFGPDRPLRAGDRITMPDLARTIELIAERGGSCLYRGELARGIVRHAPVITRGDLESYRVVWRRPVRVDFQGAEFVSNPPPSSGGVLIAYGLQLLEERGLGGPPGSAGAIARLADVMEEQTLARRRRLTRRLLAGVGGTTHISVVDADGNAASLSASTGSGSGVVVPGTGLHLNNMLGEIHLTAGASRPGDRLSSLMAPSVALRDGRPRLVIGSAGSARLAGAIMQVVVNVLGHELGVQEAIDRPRVHLEDGLLHCEGGHDPEELDRLDSELVRWRERNLYFGGVSAVEMRPDGLPAAGGDPRRGGVGIVVE